MPHISFRRPEGPGPATVTNRPRVGGNAGFNEEDIMSSPDSGPDNLEHLKAVIHERTLDVLGAYFEGIWRARSVRLAAEDPATIASEIAAAISEGVHRYLATDPGWPDSPTKPARALEAVLFPADVAHWGNMLRAGNAAGLARLRAGVTLTPGWPHQWVLRRLSALGAIVKSPEPNRITAADEGLVSVTIRSDGSATSLYADGTTRSIGPVDESEKLVESIVRTRPVDSLEGQYMDVETLKRKLAERNRQRRDT